METLNIAVSITPAVFKHSILKSPPAHKQDSSSTEEGSQHKNNDAEIKEALTNNGLQGFFKFF